MDNAFIYINNIKFPYPSRDSGLQTVSTFVDSARTADGVMRGERIGRDVSKIELQWSALKPDVWAKMLREFEKFIFTVKYIDMVKNDWVTRTFYVGDRTAQPFLIDKTTNKPTWYLNCKANIIDVGM